MRVTKAFSIAAWLLAVPLSLPASAAPQDCRLKLIAPVELSYDNLGRPTAPVAINGQTWKMLVDTGAFATNVIEEAVGPLKLQLHKQSGTIAYVSFGVPITAYATADSFAFAGMRRDSTQLLVLPRAFTAIRRKDDEAQLAAPMPPAADDANAPGADAAATDGAPGEAQISMPNLAARDWIGTLGLDILQNFDLEFDFAKNKLNLISPDRCPGTEAVYWSNAPYAKVSLQAMYDAHLQFRATLDGHPVDILMDTGASQTAMNFAVARELFGIAITDPLLTDVAGKPVKPDENVMMRYPFEALTFDGLTITNPKINLFPYAAYDNGRLVGGRSTIVLGMDILRRLHLYVSYKEGAVYMTPAGG